MIDALSKSHVRSDDNMEFFYMALLWYAYRSYNHRESAKMRRFTKIMVPKLIQEISNAKGQFMRRFKTARPMDQP